MLLPTRGMRLDVDALESTLMRCARARIPVLLGVAVLGSTEYGTIDPVDAMLAARVQAARDGLGFSVHVDAAWGGYLVLAPSKSEAEAWAEDCLWMWDTWSVPFGQDRPPLLIGDPDHVSRMIDNALKHVPFREVFCLFGQGILEPDRCKTTLELFAEKVIPRFQ